MNWTSYLEYFDHVLQHAAQIPPYDQEDYLHYAQLNHARMKRWIKQGSLTTTTKQALSTIDRPQRWILITEPWCGDAAHIVPFIEKMSAENPLITLEIQLRDSDSEIDRYLTNGGKAIPKLIIRDEAGKDIAVWGPRPQACQELFIALKESGQDFEQQKIALQKWYNEDKGMAIQEEVSALATCVECK